MTKQNYKQGDVVLYEGRVAQVIRTSKTWLHSHDKVEIQYFTWETKYKTLIAEEIDQLILLITKSYNHKLDVDMIEFNKEAIKKIQHANDN